MTELVVRDLPEEVEQRLRRRAERHGHSLEAEARLVLSEAAELPASPSVDDNDWATRLAMKMQESGITNEDIDELERTIAEGRKQWRTRDLGIDE